MSLYFPLNSLPILANPVDVGKLLPLKEKEENNAFITSDKIELLAEFLKCKSKDITLESWGFYVFDDAEYYVLTQQEADEKAKEYILDTVWAFNPDFLAEHSNEDEELFQSLIDNGRCEDNNRCILSLLIDEDDFVKAAIKADGRGHFISGYDGEENEYKEHFIYRIN